MLHRGLSGRAAVALLTVSLGTLAGCSSGTPAPANPTGTRGVSASGSSADATSGSPTPATSGSSSTATTSAASGSAQQVFDAMTEKQRVGQLLMVDCPSTGVSDATRTALTQYAVGSVILDGTTTAGLQAVRQVTAQLESDNPSPAKLFISTDQEGGLVQRLKGSGFSTIPSGTSQGRIDPSTLQSDAQRWGAELRSAGVNVNLAPVLDTVPAGGGPNPPIGDLDREYGHTPSAVTSHGLAFARGMAAAGVDATAKHFPGLGRVSGNTDTTGGVTDTVTTRDDAYLAPFAAAVKAGVPFVMMSTAEYSRIDPGVPAAFSRTIVTGMLRGDLGFTGVVVTDDVGAAKQVAGVPVGDRAVRFVQAGGDMVLTVDATQAQEMTQALLQKASSDPSFKKLVDASALRVLKAKQARGLLG